MPFYTFATRDEDVDKKVFEVLLTFTEYDEVTKAKTKPLIHPDTEKPVKEWKRILDNVNVQFAQPWESSKWDNFEYRAAYNLFRAQDERRNAQDKSHVGTTPYQRTEKQYLEGGDVHGVESGYSDIGEHDMANFEGKVV